jgi:aldose 1-epimerase
MSNDVEISVKKWGSYKNKQVYLFKLRNDDGAYIELTNYGATLVSAFVPDKKGELYSPVLGFASLQGYLDDTCYIGSTIGRYANRIGNAQFPMDNKIYRLDANENGNYNHGGIGGFNTKVFSYELSADGICFSLISYDGENGFPGNLDFKVTYSWNNSGELKIHYQAVSDKNTVANFTNHAYFNLNPCGGNILDHKLTVFSNHVVETDNEFIPTGFIRPAGALRLNGELVRAKIKVSERGVLEGLNNCYILDDKKEGTIKLAASLWSPTTEKGINVYTDYPSLMIYTGDFLLSTHRGHNEIEYNSFSGLCMECQYYPDSPNHSHFPSTILKRDEIYDKTIIYKFI